MALQNQSTASADESIRKQGETIDDLTETASFSRGCCCFWNFNSRKSVWQRISPASSPEENQRESGGGGDWWRWGVEALMKAREWSELVAGPKWKTFIRRFNKADGGRSRTGKFQYDPFSYALNFDEGKDGEVEEERFSRNFSMRYAAVTAQSNLLKVGG